MEILEALKSKKPDEVAKDFNIGYSTVKKIRQNEEEEAGIIDEPMPRVSHKDALMHLSMARKYLEENYTEYNSYYDIEDMIEKTLSLIVLKVKSRISSSKFMYAYVLLNKC